VIVRNADAGCKAVGFSCSCAARSSLHSFCGNYVINDFLVRSWGRTRKQSGSWRRSRPTRLNRARVAEWWRRKGWRWAVRYCRLSKCWQRRKSKDKEKGAFCDTHRNPLGKRLRQESKSRAERTPTVFSLLQLGCFARLGSGRPKPRRLSPTSARLEWIQAASSPTRKR
jgi:hypothetical protein